MENKKNCTERIIFCIDLNNEMDSLDFSRGASNKKNYPTRLDLIKCALRIFVNTKQKINPNHEYGIIALTDGAIWYQDLTTDVDIFAKKLNSLQSQGEYNSCNLNSLFELLNTKFPEIVTASTSPPKVIYRTILIYGRSNVIPSLQRSALIKRVLSSPVFYFDALYLHSKPSKDTCPQEIYDFITEIECNAHIQYFFENSTSLRKFFLHCTHLLAHPLQRQEQDTFKTLLSELPQ